MWHGLIIFCLVVSFCWLAAKQASSFVFAISASVFILLLEQYGSPSVLLQMVLWVVLVGFTLGAVRPLRKKIVSGHLFHLISKVMPAMSATERQALEAGTVNWEGDLFSGSPDFDSLRNAPIVQLTKEEQAFLDGPTTSLCRMIDDWDITHNRTDLPEEIWSFIKKNKFLGMIIPKSYGGLEFSKTAQMSILVKLYGRSITVATTVSVPNSLGPAELLLKYGTKDQKDYYLPRLANGDDIPCFALTGPNAGSDAASIPDQGVVCRQMVNGKEVIGVRLNWDKRYITLCPVATVIGLAFRLFDPENILSKGHDIGISCALIPAHTPGVIKGRRHFPLNTAFLNGPTQGKDVFIPMDALIGGEAMVGHGWRMLMECLSAGRAISLPSSALGGAQTAALACGAYSRVRRQFNQSIANFEGIEEPLARIAGNTYMIDAALTMAAACIDQGEEPAVAGAILKYHTTEKARQIAADAMDIHGGKGICLGPKNYLGRSYQAAPISITVEGANILSRSLIIFGQGAIRCHPYVLREIESIRNKNLDAFDQAFWSHTGFVFANLIKSVVFSITDARLTEAPHGPARRYYQLVRRYSSHLAFLADASMIFLGGELKRKEKISARLGDILSSLYFISAVLKRFHDEDESVEDQPLVQWCCQQLFYECELAIQGVIANFPVRWARVALKLMVQPFGVQRRKPSDRLGQKLAKILTWPNGCRSRLTRLVFTESLDNCPLGQLEEAFNKVCVVDSLERIISRASKAGQLQSLSLLEQISEALEKKILNKKDAQLLREAELARQRVIAVDDFTTNELAHHIHQTDVGNKSKDPKEKEVFTEV